MSRQKKRMHTFALLLFLIASVAGQTQAKTANSLNPADSLQLSAVVGLDGYYKEDKWTQVKVFISNRGGDFQGRVRIAQRQPGGPSANAVYERPVTISVGQTATVSLQVPGALLRDAKLTLQQAGTELEELPLQGKPIQDPLVATLGDPNLFPFFTQVSTNGTTVIRPIERTDVIAAIGLDSIDLLVVNNPAAGSLQSEQVQAIRQWVEMGGTLVVGSSPELAGELVALKDLLAILPNGQKKVDLRAFNQLAKGPAPAGELPVASGDLQGGRPLVKADETVLVALKKIGSGRVVQATYDLTAEPLASWKGNAEYWQDTLAAAQAGLTTGIRKEPLPRGNLINLRNYVPNLKLVPVGVNALLFTGYLLLAGPGIYWILRRKDKREWGWLVVPGLAVLLTGGILATGFAISCQNWRRCAPISA